MSNQIYPTLPGLAWPTTRIPSWSTTVKEADSGRKFGVTTWTSPRWTYKLKYEFLREWGQAEWQQLVGFFNAHRGDWDTWLYDDPDDNTAVDEQFGVGNASAVSFQLMRQLGGIKEPIYELNGAPIVKVNGVVTAVTVGAKGLITFASPPPAAAVLRWSGKYYWRCRFTKSSLEFEQFMKQLWSAKTVEFHTEKPS